MIRPIKAVLALAAALSLSACANYASGPFTNVNAAHPQYMPTVPPALTPAQQAEAAAPPPAPNYMAVNQPNRMYRPRSSGSLFRAAQYEGLFTDTRAFRVGDVISIVLDEKTQASTRSATSANKASEISMSPSVFGANASTSLQMRAGGERSVGGSGNSSQSAQLSGELTVTVAQVLPNKNLVVIGEKRLTINQGLEHLRISGLVRPQDITPFNTVPSSKVANANVEYASKGLMKNANEPGWAARLLFAKVWPF